MSYLLPVMEHFYTVQGEGAFSGVPAYFVRLGGCDVGCVWCDVKESWDADKHPKYSCEEILGFVKSSKAEIVVITGGEPAMYDLRELTELLQKSGFRTHVETSAAYEIKGFFDFITLSPKKYKRPQESEIRKANELKVVVFNASDFAWAEEFAALVHQDCALFLQPEWSKHDKMANMIFDYVKENPKWRMSLQTHKFIGVD